MINTPTLQELLGEVFEDTQVEIPEKVERKNKLSFVISDEELELLNQTRGSIKLSEYLRAVLFKQRLPIPCASIPAVNRETLVQLNRMGSLLNQQATALNTAKSLNSFSGISQQYLQHCLVQLEELKIELNQLGREIVLLNTGTGSNQDDRQDL